jgi:hypothetical protein
MKVPRVTVATAGFAVMVIAINLGVARLALPDLAIGALDWATGDAFLLLPMIDVVLIALYRLRRRECRTRRAVGFVAVGAVATCLTFAIGQLAPETTTELLEAVCTPIEYALVLLSRDVAMENPSVRWMIANGYEYLLPMALFNVPPLLAALLGGWVARRIWTVRSFIGASREGEVPAGTAGVVLSSPNDSLP